MNYKHTLDYLFNSLPMYQNVGKAAYKANLNNTIALDIHLGHPHRRFKTIHVAGTNGKGSVSHMLASVFQVCGFKTGLYTSPHLFDFRERIKINGQAISEEEVVRFVEENKQVFEDIKPSFFEMTVAMAFNAFRAHQVDVAIIETGLGGRLDSTNIIEPILSVITNIALDHTQFLGSTLREIAGEKAGIIKPNVPVLIGETQDEIADVFTEAAKKHKSEIRFADQQLKSRCVASNFEKQSIEVDEDLYELDLLGVYQAKNIVTALAALNQLKPHFDFPKEKIKAALSAVKFNTGLIGRWDIVSRQPLIICETSHNEAGIIEMVKQLRTLANGGAVHIVTGMVNDKDANSILKHLPKKARYYFTQAQISRAMPADNLQCLASEFSLVGDTFYKVDDAIISATNNAQNTDVIIVTGSIFLIADALNYFKSLDI